MFPFTKRKVFEAGIAEVRTNDDVTLDASVRRAMTFTVPAPGPNVTLTWATPLASVELALADNWPGPVSSQLMPMPDCGVPLAVATTFSGCRVAPGAPVWPSPEPVLGLLRASTSCTVVMVKTAGGAVGTSKRVAEIVTLPLAELVSETSIIAWPAESVSAGAIEAPAPVAVSVPAGATLEELKAARQAAAAAVSANRTLSGTVASLQGKLTQATAGSAEAKAEIAALRREQSGLQADMVTMQRGVDEAMNGIVGTAAEAKQQSKRAEATASTLVGRFEQNRTLIYVLGGVVAVVIGVMAFGGRTWAGFWWVIISTQIPRC